MRYFLDTEFNGMGGKLISLAFVSEDDRHLYLATGCQDPIPWVAENVMTKIAVPGARPIYVHPHQFATSIQRFLSGDPDPVMVSDWPDDIKYFCECLITGPGQMINLRSIKFELKRVDAYPTDMPGAIQHNALWDARALRHLIMGLGQ